VQGSQVPAARHERGDDVVADVKVRDAGPEHFDDARALVPEHHRQRPWTIAVDHGEVRVAQARGPHGDQHFAGARRIKRDLVDHERS